MLKFIRKILSFHIFDLVGAILGFSFVLTQKDMALFEIIISPRLYAIIFLSMVLIHSFVWLFGYHGENAYLKRMFLAMIKDFCRVALTCDAIIGVYFLIQLFSAK